MLWRQGKISSEKNMKLFHLPMMMMMKLPNLVCADKLETYSLVYRAKNQELKPISRVKTENSPISRGSQSGVSMVRDLWRK